MSDCQIHKSPELWQLLCEQLYQQYRRNQAAGKRPIVDILATEQYADLFHSMLQDEANSSFGIPVIVRWEEGCMQMLDMRYRRYEAGQLLFPRCEVNVCIPSESSHYEHIFAVPDYEAGFYFDFLTSERRPIPRPEALAHD